MRRQYCSKNFRLLTNQHGVATSTASTVEIQMFAVANPIFLATVTESQETLVVMQLLEISSVVG
jgi:hypothetical protein